MLQWFNLWSRFAGVCCGRPWLTHFFSFTAPILWRYLSDFILDKTELLFQFLYFLNQTIEASIERNQRKLVDTLNNVFETDLFSLKVADTECLSVFSAFNWEKIVQVTGDVESQKSGTEIVVIFLSNILDKVPEVFYRLKPVVESLLKATTLSTSGQLFSSHASQPHIEWPFNPHPQPVELL